MNLLQVGTYLYPDVVGGAEVSAQSLRLALERRGHNILSIKRGRGWNPLRTALRETSNGALAVNWRPYPPVSPGALFLKPIFYALEFIGRYKRADLKAFLTKHEVDGILVHSFRGLGYDLLKVFADSRVPLIVFAHDYGLICMNKSQRRRGRNCLSKCAQCRLVVAMNRRGLLSAARLGIVGPSRFIVNEVRGSLGDNLAQYAHLPNANFYDLEASIRSNVTGTLVLGLVGRLEAEKGVELALEAVRLVSARRPVRLVVAGDGSLRRLVLEWADRYEWVDYRGQVPVSELKELFASLHLVLLPSLWEENFPGVAVQAITAGVPVVGSARGGIPEIIEHDRSGWLLDSVDPAEWALAIEQLGFEHGLIPRLSRGALEKSDSYLPDVLEEDLCRFVENLMAP